MSTRPVLDPVSGIVLGLVLASGALPAAAQTSGDPNYAPTAAGCVPGDRDYDCAELHDRGIGDIVVVGTDWQHLDVWYDRDNGYWIIYPDGVDCGWYGE